MHIYTHTDVNQRYHSGHWYIHVYTHTYTYTYEYTYLYRHINANTYKYINTYTYIGEVPEGLLIIIREASAAPEAGKSKKKVVTKTQRPKQMTSDDLATGIHAYVNKCLYVYMYIYIYTIHI